MASLMLGRRLLAPVNKTPTNDEAQDMLLLSVQQNDRFFCDTMELIPAQFYFPTDEEENWKKSAPKNGKKYHRDILAQKQQMSSKKVSKRAKFNPTEQKTNEERQQQGADEEKKQKQQAAVMMPVVAAKDPSAVSIDGLKERLAAKLAAMREQRKADEKDGKKRKSNAAAKAEPAEKKRKTAASNGSAFNNKNKPQEATGAKPTDAAHTNGTSANGEPAADVSAASISYGSLLLADEGKKAVKKTRNGQGVRKIQNLLKKAERNQERMEELKKTEEGKALVQAKNWDKAIKQASGELVFDDPKLLRKKLKKKEKAKAKSSKEWKKRTALVEIQKKERVKKRNENLTDGSKRHNKDEKAKTPRAGFEGKKGEGFLNSGDKKAPAADEKAKSTGDKQKKK